MIRFKDYSPSSGDSKSNYVSFSKVNRDHWYVLNCTYAPNDSDLLHESNWQYILKTLNPDKVSGIELHKFNHWACGKYYLILIHPWNKKARELGADIEYQLNSYPVLDESDLEQRTMECEDKAWQEDIQHDFRRELNAYFDVDCTNVSESDLFYYFRTLCDKSNSHIEVDYQYGASIDCDYVASHGDIDSLVLALPDIQVSALAWQELKHETYHTLLKTKVGDIPRVVKDLEGNILDAPSFITVQYDARQLPLI